MVKGLTAISYRPRVRAGHDQHETGAGAGRRGPPPPAGQTAKKLTFVNIEKHTGPARTGGYHPGPGTDGNPAAVLHKKTHGTV